MDQARIGSLREQYAHALLDDVVPFWLTHSLDAEHGGYLTCLDRDGSVYGTDKSGWMQGRGTWLFSKLYNTVEKRDEWLDAARCGYEFLTRHCFDDDGRMFFTVTRDGRPLRKRRYLFTETFGVIACSEYARATDDEAALQRARDTYGLAIALYRTPGSLPPKVMPETRVTRAHAMPMVLLGITQELRQADSDPLYAEVIDESLQEVLSDFVKPDERALF
ncbi:MAG: AGE family epimerase/isomerase, partial [Armatimonadota bacterium]